MNFDIPRKEKTLNPQQRALLFEIENNQYSKGPFSGMIFNEIGAFERYREKRFSEEEEKKVRTDLIKRALNVKLGIKELLEE